jgi:rubrerythrin
MNSYRQFITELKSNVASETDAGAGYRKLALLARNADYSSFADIIEQIAIQEQTHKTILQAIIREVSTDDRNLEGIGRR